MEINKPFCIRRYVIDIPHGNMSVRRWYETVTETKLQHIHHFRQDVGLPCMVYKWISKPRGISHFDRVADLLDSEPLDRNWNDI